VRDKDIIQLGEMKLHEVLSMNEDIRAVICSSEEIIMKHKQNFGKHLEKMNAERMSKRMYLWNVI